MSHWQLTSAFALLLLWSDGPAKLDSTSSQLTKPRAIRLVHATTPLSDDNEFNDLAGKSYSFKASPDRKALVLIFVTTDCPIANSYLPALTRLQQTFQKRGFEFAMVHEGPNQTAIKLENHAKDFDVPFSIVMDAKHLIAKRVGATKTPEAFVFGREGQVLYQGRIDDLHQAFGKKRSAATREDLRIALEEIEAGKNVSTNKTEAVGCSIPLAIGR